MPDLLEETEHGPIPRIAATGETPFEVYARPSLTPATADGKKLIAIVVTGLGLNEIGTASAIDTLPDTVTLAFAPYGRSLSRTVASARAGGHEILLEMPLEPFDYPDSDPGPDTLLTGQAPRDNLNKLFTVMAQVRRLCRAYQPHGRALHRVDRRFRADDGRTRHPRPRLRRRRQLQPLGGDPAGRRQSTSPLAAPT